jgi:hypothetical protein
VATKSTILLLKSVAVVKCTLRDPGIHAVAISTTIPEFRNVVITTLSNQREPNALDTAFKLSALTAQEHIKKFVFDRVFQYII